MQSVKGITRQYRKTLKFAGIKFPLRGAFHVRIRGGAILPPNDVLLHPDTQIVPGPAPDVVTSEPEAILLTPADLPPLPDMYTRRERVSPTDGKKRIDYTLVRNPKSGQRYFVKESLPNGRTKYVEADFTKIVTSNAAVA